MLGNQSLNCHVYIAAMGRSGSTMLANMLTQPPSHCVLVEPWLPKGRQGPKLLEQLRRFGVPISDSSSINSKRGSEADSQRRIERLLDEMLGGLSHWGIKEVRPEMHFPTLKMVTPEMIILQVRNIRDVTLSLIEKHARGSDRRYNLEWTRKYICTAASTIVKLRRSVEKTRFRIIRYEDFVTSAKARQELEEWLQWPLDGDPGRNLDLFDRYYESERHGKSIGRSSVDRWKREFDPIKVNFANEMADCNRDYQSEFCYE
jgi:hypothetical protein